MNETRYGWQATRRDFLKVSSAALAGLSLSTSQWAHGAPTESIRFGLVTDSHFAEREPAGVRFYSESLGKMEECVQLMNDKQVGFLIELGDFKDQGDPPAEEKTLEYLKRIEGVFSKFDGPRYHALGNHDTDSISKGQFLASVKNTGIPAERSYYSFDVKGLHCVVLDANFLRDGSSYDHGNFKWTDPNVPAAELAWLKKDLDKAKGPVIVFLHQRLDGEGDVFVTNAAEVRAVLEKNGKVLAVFQGHHHEGAINQIHGIHYYTLKALVEGSGPDQNAFAIAELDGRGNISVTGYKRAVSQDLRRFQKV